jgi:hypothetical protein
LGSLLVLCGLTAGLAYAGWQGYLVATDAFVAKINSSGGLQVPLLPILGSTSARIQITPLGAGSRWLIDDLYIDPWVNRIG